MYLKKTKQKNGRIHLDIMDNYYDPEKKITRQKTIISIGYVDELSKKHENPIEYYTDLLQEYKKALENSPLSLSFHFQANEKIDTVNHQEKNLGFIVFSKIYHGLEIHKFFNNKQRHRSDSYNANELFKILLNGNLISRYSRKSWFQKKKYYYIPELIDYFQFVNDNSFDLIKWLNKHIQNYYDRGSCYVYENIAKFQFTEKNSAELEINKEQTTNHEYVQNSSYLSMYLDSHGVPYAYRKTDKYTLHEDPKVFLDKLKKELGIQRFVIVGDRITKTEEELNEEIVSNENDRYVFSVNPINASPEIQKYILDVSDEKNYYSNTKTKSRLHPRIIILADGSKKVILENQLVLKNKSQQSNDELKRETLINKARSIIKYTNQYSVVNIGEEIKYIKSVSFLPDGTIDLNKSILELDTDKINHEKKFDGIKLIITNEPIKSISHIIDVYYYQHSLENVLKNTRCTMQKKSPNFKQFNYNNYTTTVHTVTFTALVMLRLLYLSLDKKYSMTTLLESIAKYNCVPLQKNYYLFTHYDSVIDDLGKRFDLDFNKRIRTLKDIKHIIANIKKANFNNLSD